MQYQIGEGINQMKTCEKSESAIKNLVFLWCDSLSKQEFDVAYGLTTHEPDFTIETLKALVKNYGFVEDRPDEKMFVITDRKFAKGKPREIEISWWKPKKVDQETYLGIVHFDLPLNGEWSDLTAIFNVLQQGEESCYLKLTDIHVL